MSDERNHQLTRGLYKVRRANADDAQAIGAVFDAAVRAGWTYLGELAEKPMFAPEDWDRLVAHHAPPNVLLVATNQAGRILGYTAVHPEDGEMFLLLVDRAHAGRGVGRTLLSAAHDALRAAGCKRAFLPPTSRTNGHWRSTRARAIAPTDRFANRTSTAPDYASCASSSSSDAAERRPGPRLPRRSAREKWALVLVPWVR